MSRLSPTEYRSRQLFLAIFQDGLRSDTLNKPGASSDNTLIALVRNTLEELHAALRKGSNPTDEYEAEAVAILAARGAGHLYAIARNNGALNDIDLPDYAATLEKPQ